MTFNPPDLTELLENENELNSRLTSLKTLLQNQWAALGDNPKNYSINQLIENMSNPIPFLVKRNSEYTNNQLGSTVGIVNCHSFLSWNKNPSPYNDTDYWYLQSLSFSNSANALSWGEFNVGNIHPSDRFELIMYGRSIDNFNNGGFSGVGFTYATPQSNTALNGLFIGITLDSGTYYPAYAIFNNTTTPTIKKVEYGKYDSASSKFRLKINNNPNFEALDLYWYDGEGNFIWNAYIDYTDLPSGFTSVNNLIFGNVCFGPNLSRLSYIPRLNFASPCKMIVL